MKNSILIIFLVLIIAAAFYWLGKKEGAGQTKTEIAENISVVKQIAELAALNVTGTTELKISNKGGDATWDKFKSYFVENTLMLSLPFDAKYGVDLSNHEMKVDTKKGKITLYLPDCKLLSFQLRIDKMQTMSETGIFTSASMDDFVKAQKQLYREAEAKLQKNPSYIKLARENIKSVLSSYYSPLGYELECVFAGSTTTNKQ